MTNFIVIHMLMPALTTPNQYCHDVFACIATTVGKLA